MLKFAKYVTLQKEMIADCALGNSDINCQSGCEAWY